MSSDEDATREAAEYKAHYEEMCRENATLKAQLAKAEQSGSVCVDRVFCIPPSADAADNVEANVGLLRRVLGTADKRLAEAEAAGAKMRAALLSFRVSRFGDGPQFCEADAALIVAALASDLGRAALAERERLRAALDGLLDGLDANGDPERCGLSQEQWDRRIAAARAARETKPCP